jgi:MoxR-like ATPase
MDRFFMRINPGYPERTVEEEIIINHGFFRDIENLPAVLSSGDIVMMQSRIQSVYVDEKIRKYLMDIVHATRNSQFFDTGISTRGAICLYTAAKAIAYLHSRAYCLPDDVKELVIPVFCHRVAVKSRTSSALPSRDEAIAVLSDILDSIPSP